MITLILATDMARHAEIMDSFKEKMENFDYSNEEHMTLVGGLALPLGLLHGAMPARLGGRPRNESHSLAVGWGPHTAGTRGCDFQGQLCQGCPTHSPHVAKDSVSHGWQGRAGLPRVPGHRVPRPVPSGL